ncbi:MAG: fibronectin type III domain-containing protein [Ferruginibacter sp.]
MKCKLILALTFCLTNALSFAQVARVTENQKGISERLQFEIDNTKDPALGYVPQYRLVNAYEVRQEKLSRINSSMQSPAFSWVERGPNSDVTGTSNGNTRAGNGKTSGRIRAIWEDLADATGKTVWVGGIDGGLWKTNDITVNPATWTPINDFFGNLAVSSICQDPTDVNIMYFGTGEKAINADAIRGAGVWRSTDHGVTWAVMSNTSGFYNVSKIICDASGNLYLGNNSLSGSVGMQRYTKSTGTWTSITPSGLDTRVTDIELSSMGRLHITCGYYNTPAASSGYRYTDNPATVSSATWSSPATTFPTQYNVDLASNGNTLYALPSNSAWEVPTIYKSTNGGVNWAATTATPVFTSGQSWYNMAVAVDPTNANNVIVGALDCYKSTNGGGSWTKISEWVGTAGQYVHADQQAMTWRSNNQVLISSDGGIHYSSNGGTTITDRNQGLRIKQFYSVAHHPTTTNYFIAGAQDNGTHQLTSAGLGASVEVTGGDGAFVHIDQDQPQYQWGAYVYNQYRRSTNSGSTWTSVNYSSSAGRFINPTDYDDANNVMYCAGIANTYLRWSNAQTGSTFTSVTMSGLNSGKVSAIKVSPYTSNTVYFSGGGSGITPSLIKAINANGTPTLTSIIGSGMLTASANISCIEVGSNDQNIIVVFSNYGINNIWVTANGGTSWTAIDGNLPDMPVRWALFYPGDNTKAIIATETGVWKTDLINGASTLWDPETGFPNVRVDMLQYRESDQTLSAATHGRGLFTTTLNAVASCGSVTSLVSSSITTTGATVNWAALSGAISYDVDYKLTTSGSWTNAASATTNLSVTISGLSSGTLYDWRVRANCSGATGSYTADQFATTATPTCGTVTGLISSAITSSSATLSFDALSGANDYDVDYKLNSSSNWVNAATSTTSTSINLSGLTPGSLYDWRVRANCTGATGSYTQAQFTTDVVIACGSVSGLSTTGITYSDATLNWSALSGSTSYDIDYKVSTSSTWISAATATSATTISVNALSSSTDYDWRVRANCSEGASLYSSGQFTTAAAPNCGNVTGLGQTAISTNSATLNWSVLSGANTYDADYKLNTASTWTNAATATANTSLSLAGLASGTIYDWRVRANCSGATGAYSLGQFTTVSLSCQSTYDNTTNNVITGAATIPFNTDITGLINPSGDIDNFKFVITTQGTATISLTNLPANYDLKLLNSAGSQLAISKKGGANNESISFNASAGTYYAQVYSSQNASNASSCYTVKVQLGTATITEIVADPTISVKIFPNPVKDKLNIYVLSDNAPKNLMMYDASGKVIYRQPVTDMITTLNMQKLSGGIYTVKIINAQGKIIYSEKIIKN